MLKKWQRPTFIVLGSKNSLNMCGSNFYFGRNFKKLKFLANVSSISRTIDNVSEPRRMFGKLLEPKIQMLDFVISSTFASFANRSCSRENIPLAKEVVLNVGIFLDLKSTRILFLASRSCKCNHIYQTAICFQSWLSVSGCTQNILEVWNMTEVAELGL